MDAFEKLKPSKMLVLKAISRRLLHRGSERWFSDQKLMCSKPIDKFFAAG
jgi:hypothetical protein